MDVMSGEASASPAPSLILDYMTKLNGSGTLKGGLSVVALVISVLLTATTAHAQFGEATAPHEWCDALLPTTEIEELAGGFDGRIERRTSSLVEETEGRCTRTYSVDGQRLTDDLVLLVSPGGSVDGAVRNVRFIGDTGSADDVTVHYEWVDDLGDLAFAYFGPYSPTGTVWHFTVAFAMSGHVVEVAYYNWDDGLPGKFVQSLEEVIEIARRIASVLGS